MGFQINPLCNIVLENVCLGQNEKGPDHLEDFNRTHAYIFFT